MKKSFFIFLFIIWNISCLTLHAREERLLQNSLPHLKPIIIAKIPHASDAFTQGLAIENHYLYESSGLYGKSKLSCTDLDSGMLVTRKSLPSNYFAEGIASLPDRIIQITWREQTAFVYDRPNLNLLYAIPYQGEGWGMCADNNSLWISDGTATLKRCNPTTLAVEERIPVLLNGRPVPFLNDLTVVDQHIYANVWLKDTILKIDKATGRVEGVIDASNLLSPEEKKKLGRENVLNGIAYHPGHKTFFLTGKGWPWIYEVTFSSNTELSLEEKVGQLLFVHFNGESANDKAERLINECHVGGFIYYRWSNGLTSPSQVQNLTESLNEVVRKKNHPIPLLIGVDQEGGAVNRLSHGLTHFPGNGALAQTKRQSWGYQSAFYSGQELAAVGINLNFAPVVDVQPDTKFPVIGVRSYGSDPSAVARWGAQAMQGYQDAGIIPVLKHFPGHGSTTIDSHETLPSIRKTAAELDHSDLLPFQLLAPEADVIMTAHLSVPSLDSNHCVTFSKKVITDLLRNTFQYSGVIMTDSLAMEGILSIEPQVEEAALKSLLAGHDIVLLGGKQLFTSQAGLEFDVDDIVKIHRYIVNAVRTGRYPQDSLDASLKRVIALKEQYKLPHAPLSHRRPVDPEHALLAQEIAEKALSIIHGDEILPLSLKTKKIYLVYPDMLRRSLSLTNWNPSDLPLLTMQEYAEKLSKKEIQQMGEQAGNSDICLFFPYKTSQHPWQRELFEEMRKNCPLMIAVASTFPHDIGAVSDADIVLCTYSPAPPSLQACYTRISGENQ